METLRFIHEKPYFAILLVIPILYGITAYFGAQSIDFRLFGYYGVLQNVPFATGIAASLGGMALLYRWLELRHRAIPFLITLMHVVLTSFTLIWIVWTINSMVPDGQPITWNQMVQMRFILRVLLIVFGVVQFLFLFSLAYEMVRRL